MHQFRRAAGVALIAIACLWAPSATRAAADLLPEDAPATGAPLAPSPAGNYLAGRFAAGQNDLAAAADRLGQALAADPDNKELLQRAFLSTLGAGRMAEAAALAERLRDLSPGAEMVGLTSAVLGIEEGDLAGAAALLEGMPAGGINDIALPLVRAWLTIGAEGPDAALARLAPIAEMKGLAALYHMHAGLLNDFAGRPAEAEKSYLAALAAAAEPSLRMHEIAGNFYQRQGRAADARALYEKLAAAAERMWADPLLAALDGGATAAATVPDAASGVAEALFGVATLLYQERVAESALLYTRLALHLRPRQPIVLSLLADILSYLGRGEEAVAAYRQLPPATAYGWQARRKVAELLDDLGRAEEAIAELRAMAGERPERTDAPIALGNVLRAHERFREAAEAYDLAVARLGQPRAEHWSLFYFRGIARERNKEWALAEPDFLKALELVPEQPFVLNYLAYSWVELGQNYDQALDMLKRAVELRNEDGYIVDSLGWVYYRLRQYDKAVEHLERAVELKPDDPVINDHLGDAYWRVGRKAEARFQWRRALHFEPEPDQVQPIEAKIERGLGLPSDS